MTADALQDARDLIARIDAGGWVELDAVENALRALAAEDSTPQLLRDRDRDAIRRIRGLHSPITVHDWGTDRDYCAHDGRHWPCDTIQALDRKETP